MAPETTTQGEKLRPLPSRFSLPLLGETLDFIADPARFLADRARELGPVFRADILGSRVACMTGPEPFALFLDEHFFTRASASPPHLMKIFGEDAVPFLEGDRFQRRKELLMQVFKESALDGYAPILERVMKRYARRWAEIGVLSWVPEIRTMSMAVAAALFLGADPDKDDTRFEEAFGAVARGMLAVPVNLPFTTYHRALRARDAMRAQIREGYERRVSESKNANANTSANGGGGARASKDAMARAMTAKTKSGEHLSKEEICTETFHFMTAYMPVIGGVSMLAMLLGQYPDVRERLREEIERTLGDDPQPLTVARLRQLPYLEQVCKESRRVRPVAPVTFFANVKEPCSFRGVEIPAGMKAIGCIAATLLDDKIYPEPNKFDPDRWAKGRATERQEAAWVPHGGGKHLMAHRCAGEALAELMLKTFCVVMLRDYDWAFPSSQDFGPTTGELFATPRGGLEVELRRLGASRRRGNAEAEARKGAHAS